MILKWIARLHLIVGQLDRRKFPELWERRNGARQGLRLHGDLQIAPHTQNWHEDFILQEIQRCSGFVHPFYPISPVLHFMTLLCSVLHFFCFIYIRGKQEERGRQTIVSFLQVYSQMLIAIRILVQAFHIGGRNQRWEILSTGSQDAHYQGSKSRDSKDMSFNNAIWVS